MPRLTPKGTLPASLASRRRTFLRLTAWLMPRPSPADPGHPQRAALEVSALAARFGNAVAGRYAASPGMTFTGETSPAQIVPPPLSLADIDPVAGVSAQGAGRPAFLGAKTRSVVR